MHYQKQANAMMRGGSLITDFCRYTHAAHVSFEAQRKVFDGRVISRNLCSPRCPDLTPCELFVSVGVRICFESNLCLLLQGMFNNRFLACNLRVNQASHFSVQSSTCCRGKMQQMVGLSDAILGIS
jgi:hypothetical protein